MNNPNKFLLPHSHLLSACFYRWKLWRKHHGKSKTGANATQTHVVAIVATAVSCLLGTTAWCTEGMSPRVAVNKESIQYEFMTRVISSVKMHIGKLARTRTKWHHIVSPGKWGYSYYLVNHDFKLLLNLFT